MNREELDTAAAPIDPFDNLCTELAGLPIIEGTHVLVVREFSEKAIAELRAMRAQLSSDAKTIEELRNRCETYENEVNMLRGQRSDEERKNEALRKWGDELEERNRDLEAAQKQFDDYHLVVIARDDALRELSAARVDAGRYRWLRSRDAQDAITIECSNTEFSDFWHLQGDGADTAIDAAIASQSGEKHG